jgi:urea transporter
MKERLKTILGGCAEILFLQGATAGAVLVVVLLLNPRMVLLGAVAVAAAFGFAWLVGMENRFLQSGFYVYNPLLVGLSLGYRFELTARAGLLAVLAGIFTLLLTIPLARLLVAAMRLPMLSLPFALASSILYLATARLTEMAVALPHGYTLLSTDLGLPAWAAGFFKSLGGFLFAPSVIVGALLSLLIASRSRILIMLAIAGYYVGVAIHGLMLGSWERALLDGNSFNFPLVAMALGGVLLVPSLRSGLLAMIGVAVTPFVVDAAAGAGRPWGIPPFTLPFCLVTLGAVYLLRLGKYPLLAHSAGTPEEIRENWLVERLRYPGTHRTLSLPFSGKWAVWQGCDGHWTHRGTWRHAYDFVITDEQGKTHRGEGGQLQDYYCYRMPVLSPIAGRVVKVVDDVADNAVGGIDRGQNWGNLLLLEDPRGFYVEVSHLVPRSICVKAGDWVHRGTLLGLCGNSGFSAQPHLHVQVQAAAALGSATLPFSFVSYAGDGCYHANDLPREGDQVESLYFEKRLDDMTNFVVGDVHQYEMIRRGQPAGRLSLRVGMAADGTCCFHCDKVRLYFGKYDGTFYFYRLVGDDPRLRPLLVALPRLPLAYRNQLHWHDCIPVGSVTWGWKRVLARLGSSLWPGLTVVRITSTFRGPNRVESAIESRVLGPTVHASVELDADGFASVQVGDTELRRTCVERLSPPSRPLLPPNRRRRVLMAASQAAPKSIEAGLGCLLPLLAEAKYQEAELLARQILPVERAAGMALLPVGRLRQVRAVLSSGPSHRPEIDRGHARQLAAAAGPGAIQAGGSPGRADPPRRPRELLRQPPPCRGPAKAGGLHGRRTDRAKDADRVPGRRRLDDRARPARPCAGQEGRGQGSLCRRPLAGPGKRRGRQGTAEALIFPPRVFHERESTATPARPRRALPAALDQVVRQRS